MPALIDKRLVFVAGKGGVGRTTVAAALGLAAARRGKRTIVCEVAGQERVSRTLGREHGSFRETELADHLFAISIDPQASLEEFLSDQVGSRRLAGLLFHNRLFEYLAAATPGLRELATIGKVWELAQLDRPRKRGAPYDLVIVDLPATGHGLGALRTARTFSEVARVGPVRRRADMIDSFIRDGRQTGVLAVALAEEMPVAETLEFETALSRDMGIGIDLAVVNAVLPERFSAREADEIERVNGGHGAPPVAAALRAALSEHRRARGQRAQLRRLRRSLEAPCVTLPYLFEPDLGLEDWERLSRDLERRL
ncbi:MAG TPA: ArsA-related P-loop ATPase [Thermoleophilaceae bacterium]|nr:ArsA-related P-loop ATPase [Thermoleophilaceae bacterium]